MLLSAIANITLPKASLVRQWIDFIGNPIVALVIALIFALVAIILIMLISVVV